MQNIFKLEARLMLSRIFARRIHAGLVRRADQTIKPRRSPEEIKANFPGPFHPIWKRSLRNEERDWYNKWVMQPGAWPVIGFTFLALIFATYKVLWLDVSQPETVFSPWKRQKFLWIHYEPDYAPTERRRMFLMPKKYYDNFRNWEYVPEEVRHHPMTDAEYGEYYRAKLEKARRDFPELVAAAEEEMAEDADDDDDDDEDESGAVEESEGDDDAEEGGDDNADGGDNEEEED